MGRLIAKQTGNWDTDTHVVNHNNPVSHCRSNAVLIEGEKNKTPKNSGHSEAEQRVRSYSAGNDTSMFHTQCHLTNSGIISGDA